MIEEANIYHFRLKRRTDVKNLEYKKTAEYDEHGELYDQEYVEFTVEGKNRSWQDFILLEDFYNRNRSLIKELIKE